MAPIEAVLLVAALICLGAMWFAPVRVVNSGVFGVLLLVPSVWMLYDGDRSLLLLGYFAVGIISITYWLVRRYAERR